MKRRVVWLVLAAALFAGWMIYLLQLALTHQHGIVVSPPQIQVAEAIVVAKIEDRDNLTVEVTEVLSPMKDTKGSAIEPGRLITVKNLAKCEGIQPTAQAYILPLKSNGEDAFNVVPIPRSPGYFAGSPRIYLDGVETRHQVDHILKP
jgi:hypothetical protein